MSTAMISLLFGLGVGAWVYTQLARRTGNPNPTNNFIVAGCIAAIIALIFFITLKYVLHF